MQRDPLTRRILDHVSDKRYRPAAAEALADELGVDPEQLDHFHRTVQQLVDDGQVVLGASDSIALPPPGKEMTGAFRLNERGFGFIIPDARTGHGDLFVPAPYTGGALTGDRVRARVIHQPERSAGAGAARSPYTGRVVEILQRAEKHYVGNLRRLGSRWAVEVDGTLLRDPVVIRDPQAKGARPGDKVVIELLEYPNEHRPAEGVITEVLGEQGEPDVETTAVMRAYGLADRFPEAAMREARAVSAAFSDSAVPADREDLTGQFIVTIDPPDAKDFDDAISLRRVGSGGPGPQDRPGAGAARPARGGGSPAAWELGVHIADVSHFVLPGGAMDQEAKARSNSTYLPRRVVPMLPELLSNGVCSLQEHVNRFCLSAFVLLDAAGRPVGTRFARTVIRSAKRLTYLEAQCLIDGDVRQAIKHAATEPKYPRGLMDQLHLMDELAKVIRARRRADGMISLDLPEVELVFDDSGRVIDAVPEDDAFTHKLIEMFMVEANEAAARVFANLNVPMIRRIHPEPPVHDVNELRMFARVAGYNVPSHPTRRELQQLLDGVRGKPAQHAVHLAVLQTLSRAEYAPLLVGHFALASEHYTHFTSPIRRYADLVVHRGLTAYLEHNARAGAGGRERGARGQATGPQASALARALTGDPRLPPETELAELGRHMSGMERNSQAAENELRRYLILDLLAGKLGEDYEGTVTGVTGQGVFVQLDRYLVDGFVAVNDLPQGARDVWKLNRATGALVAQRSGMAVHIGTRFTVRIARVDAVRRKLELVVVAHQNQGVKPRKRSQPEGARQAHQETLRLKKKRREDRRRQR